LLKSLIGVLSWGIYHAYFHPLSRFPGPKLWAAYRLPFAIYNIRGQLPFKVLELHRKYGPVVRIAPNELAFTDSQAWNDIYGMQSGRVQNQKCIDSYTPLQPGSEKGIIIANDATHARLRRIYGPAFSLKAVEEQADMLLKYANLLVTQLKKAVQKQPVQDMSAWYNFTTFDLTGDFAFGEAFHCLDRGGEYHFFVKTVFDGVSLGLQMQQLEHYGFLSLLKPFIPKSFVKPKEDMDQYTQELVDRRVDRGYEPGKMDVFNYLLLNKSEEDQLTPPELYENASTLVVAGSETTATLLTGTTYFLCKNPDVLRKAQQEVRSMFKEDSEITPKSVNELSYMIAVLSESMRIYPPTSFGIPRSIASKGGQSVAGYWVPEKVRLLHWPIFHWCANKSAADSV
jgi:cytochrome P450